MDPHDGERRFSEVTLTRVTSEPFTRGQVIVAAGTDAKTVGRHTTDVCFADPRWRRRSEDEVAELLGEDSIRELRSFAGPPGDYTPERLFGATGKDLANAVRAHNRKVRDELEAQIKEWTN